jgi:hypothetical protein
MCESAYIEYMKFILKSQADFLSDNLANQIWISLLELFVDLFSSLLLHSMFLPEYHGDGSNHSSHDPEIWHRKRVNAITFAD